MTHEEKLSIFSDLEAAISAALHESFVLVNTPTVSLMFCYIEIMQITCCIYKDFVRQLKAFLPSFCHLCACGMIIVQILCTIKDKSIEVTFNDS